MKSNICTHAVLDTALALRLQMLKEGHPADALEICMTEAEWKEVLAWARERDWELMNRPGGSIGDLEKRVYESKRLFGMKVTVE
jgi:hypothetical protein